MTDDTTNQNLTDNIAAIHTQLGDIAAILTDCTAYAKKKLKTSCFPDTSIPYYKLALQSQRQFCQTVKTLHDITTKKPKQKQDT